MKNLNTERRELGMPEIPQKIYKLSVYDENEILFSLKAKKMYCVLWDFDQWLRSEIKYNGKDLQEVRDKLHEFMSDNFIDLDELS